MQQRIAQLIGRAPQSPEAHSTSHHQTAKHVSKSEQKTDLRVVVMCGTAAHGGNCCGHLQRWGILIETDAGMHMNARARAHTHTHTHTHIKRVGKVLQPTQLRTQKRAQLVSQELRNGFRKQGKGVPIVAQWLANATSIHKDVGFIPGLTQWIKDLVLL